MNRRDALRKTALFAGSAIAAPTILSMLQSCAKQDRLTWQPVFLNEDQTRFISSFVDTILPKTETPGALDVKTDIFMDLVFAKTYNKEALNKLVADIEKFNADCKSTYGDVFADLSQEDKTACLKAAEASSPKFNPRVWGTAVGDQEPVGFYRSLKAMAISAYFSSEEIGKNVLSYDPIPGEYLSCIPLSDVGNTWSL
ncbi:gluconate 2-dehydrogenase subunit 3 family protein [Aquiflexum sp. TKW24L]|uniref:gluconate 2-dehydrogenase subunit 3 family protein n=1 Tax=Aquiflexum sp. TKW24L TaxID=2942212 RepID=UPI0020BF9CB9|nr:gluconate 2-dehydrogenase subunit 3 family protein [Aquiflexum sp. TKW24L]MCL6261390.1 gluconate 2-dehydrogenase subunit 3 family protein [Aquiflexum sp. TKW24L]